MPLARSASVPGSLSLNTALANTLGTTSTQPAPSSGLFASTTASDTPTLSQSPSTMSLFGNTQQKPAGALFGTSTAAPATGSTSGGLLGQSTANTQQTQGTGVGLFGNAQNTQTQQQQSGGLFGSKPAAIPTITTTTTTGGGLFGNTGAQQTAQQSGGPFSNTQNQQQQGTQQPSGGSLFGAAAQNQQQQQQQGQQATGTGLFANTNANQQTGTTGATFGQSTQQFKPAGLFGASTTMPAAQPGATGGLFGQSQAKPSTGLFGQSQAQPSQPGQSVPAVSINFDNLRPRSRFDDLAQPLQDEITNMDKKIQTWMKMKDDIAEFMPQHERDIDQLGRDVKFVEVKFKSVQAALNRDIQTVKVLHDMTKKNITDAQLSFKAADNLKLPQHYHQTGLFASTSTPPPDPSANASASSAHGNAQDLITYFNRICDDVEKYKKRLDDYRSQIEQDLPGVENGLYEQIKALRERNAGGAGSGAVQDQLGQVLLALRETGTAIVSQAGIIADTREKLSRLQAGMYSSGVYAVGL